MESFDGAQGNLTRLLEKNRKRYQELSAKSPRDLPPAQQRYCTIQSQMSSDSSNVTCSWNVARGVFLFVRYCEHSYFYYYTQGLFLELSFPKSIGVHDRFHIYHPFRIFYFPWHRHQIEGTTAIGVSSERHWQCGLNELAQDSTRRATTLHNKYRVSNVKAKMWTISIDTHQLHYIPKHHFIM